MSIQQLLITEVSQQPEPLLREVWHYLNVLKAKAADEQQGHPKVRPGFASANVRPGSVCALMYSMIGSEAYSSEAGAEKVQ